MSSTRDGSIRLFRLLGIDVHLHWSWFVVAIYAISNRVRLYETPLWAALEYVALFLIVLLHEFGHSLACRQVGGKSDLIILWPLGGAAYVSPPQRPGATLWSIAAGPLVNVGLVPILYGLALFASGDPGSDRGVFLNTLFWLNLGLLVFNLLPIYPLDGGQMLRSLLWYAFGRAHSLLISTVIGFLGGVALAVWAVKSKSIWTGVIALYLLSVCWGSFKQAQALRKIERLPRRREYACVSCHSSPPVGNYWLCPQCRQAFDPFASSSACPHCQAILELVTCPDCGEARAQRAWDASIRNA